MDAKDFTGRGASVKGLCEAFMAGAPVHASLLMGPAGVGKRTLATALAQSLYCTGGPPKPCGECPPCKRFAAGSHPDAYRIAEKKRIGVDEIRELIAALSATAYEGGWRTVIIECAGAMTPQAQNSLLKTLEEPPPRTVFLLTAISGAQLLPTIRSRCRIVQVPPFAQGQVEAILMARGVERARAKQLAAMAQGSVGRAIAMDGDERFWALRDKVMAAMAAVHGSGDVLAAVNALKDDKADTGTICDLIEQTLRDAMVGSVSGNTTGGEGWGATLDGLPPRVLVNQMENTAQMRRMLASNVSWQAVLERFLLEYSEDIRTWQS